MIAVSHHIREGRDAVIAERFQNGPAAINPYPMTSKRGVFWQRGAERAQAKIAELLGTD